MRCTVRFTGMIEEKTHQRLKLSLIPVGEYPITVAWGGRELSTKIQIRDGQRTIVAVSFMKGDEPITVSYEPE